MLRILAISCLLSTIAQGSIINRGVKLDEEVKIHFSDTIPAIKRIVLAGTQIWNFEGKHAGYFVDEDGKKIHLENDSNYESAPNNTLIIKKFAKADVGQYRTHPDTMIRRKLANGNISGKAGPVLRLLVKKEEPESD